MNNLPEMTYLIVYGSPVSGIKIEGKSIPQLNEEEQKSLPIGWYKDSSANRVILRLPRGINNEVEIVK
jgi:hypothetical protein